MRFRIYKYLALVSSILMLSCSTEEITTIPEQQPVTVGFWAGDVSSRTAMNTDGISTSWKADDKLSLWAKDASDSYTFSNQQFKVYYLSQPSTRAFFTTTLAQAMSAGSYTYYATYPTPTSITGTQATFTLPAEQDGLISGGADIMIANATTASALTEDSDLSMSMKHKLHALKFYIPEGGNTLGEPVKRIVFTMPQAIAGTVTADIADASANASLSNGVTTMTLNLADDLDASTSAARTYSFASIFPSQAYTDGVLSATLYSDNYAAKADDISLAGRQFVEGHVTPVCLTLQAQTNRYKIRFTLGTNNLGENVQKVTLTAPTGINWTVGGSNVLEIDATNTLYNNGYYDISYDDDAAIALYKALSGKQITATYESANAIVTGSFTMPDMSSSNIATVALTVPYLYSEDFSGTTTSSNYNDNNKTSATSSGSNTAVDLSQSSYGWPQGWNGARCGIQAGTAVRVCCRSEKAAAWPGTYNGRIDSPAMTNIKSGKTVTLKITFNYSLNRASSKSTANQHYLAIGTHTTSGNIDASSGVGSWVTNPLLGYTIDANIAADLFGSLDGSYTNIYKSASYTASECTNANRFAFEVYIKSKSPDGYYNNWVYIDNIKVQIAQ